AVLQALARQPFRGWSADQAPVGGADAIAGVVEENDDDIRCSCRRLPKSRVIGARLPPRHSDPCSRETIVGARIHVALHPQRAPVLPTLGHATSPRISAFDR